MMRTSNTSYTIEQWLRLPLFLQQAGRFDEAMLEFGELIAEMKPRIAREFGHATANVRRSVVSSELSRLYDKMRLACQREKLAAEAERYATLSKQHRSIRAKLDPIIKAERKRRFAAFNARMDAMRASRKQPDTPR
jgi:hypothetical protein